MSIMIPTPVPPSSSLRMKPSFAMSPARFFSRSATRSFPPAMPMKLCASLTNASPSIFLLTDVVMPGMNGSDLAEQLKLMDPTLKTIYMSGYTSNPLVRKGFANPRIAYLQKPFTLEALGKKVKEVLDESEPAV